MRTVWLTIFAGVFSAGCSGFSAVESDSATDRGVDAGHDDATDLPLPDFPLPDSPASDVSADTPPDSPVDVPVDVPADLPVDLPVDAPIDLPADVPIDVPPDAAPDAPLDTAPDAPPDTIPTIPVDVALDAPPDAPLPDLPPVGSFGQVCQNFGGLCPDGISFCYAFPFDNRGFCTRTCGQPDAVCLGTPAATVATCSIAVPSSGDGTVWVCGFVCKHDGKPVACPTWPSGSFCPSDEDLCRPK